MTKKQLIGLFSVFLLLVSTVIPLGFAKPPSKTDPGPTLQASTVKIDPTTNVLYVNGSPFVIRGVDYSPVPVGKDVWSYNWWTDPNTYGTDFPLIREMGANTIRVYDATGATAEAMDAAYNNNLYVIMGYWVDYYQDLSDPTVRGRMIEGFAQMVSKWKDHPAVLMWCFGNEVNLFYGGDMQDWFTLLQEAAQTAHDLEGENYHPVITAHGGYYPPNVPAPTDLQYIGDSSIGAADEQLSALDAWGLNVYRGQSFGTLFEEYAARTNKPLILTEWGADAWDARYQREEQSIQANYVETLWMEIEANLAPAGVALGGTVFEWSDEWWKAGSPSTHDTNGQWANSNYYDYIPGESNINEEWWGITAVSPHTYNKTLRQAYYRLAGLWGKTFVVYSDEGALPNEGTIITWSDGNQGRFSPFYRSRSSPEGSRCFRTSINSGTWAGWGIFLYQPRAHTIDLSAYQELKFWVNTPADLKVEIEDDRGYPSGTASVYISAYGWDDPNTWQEVTIPLQAFVNAKPDLKMDSIQGIFKITIETRGTFYVDYVRLVRSTNISPVSAFS